MKKKFAIGFGSFGYLVGVCYCADAYFPLTPDLLDRSLWFSCVSCMNVSTPYADRWKFGVIIFGPLNAVIYPIVGFLLGAALLRFRRARRA